MSEKRTIGEVVDAMLAVIPDVVGTENLRAGLRRINESAGYTAPEQMRIRWVQLRELLISDVGAPAPGWTQQVSDIFEGRVGGEQTEQDPKDKLVAMLARLLKEREWSLENEYRMAFCWSCRAEHEFGTLADLKKTMAMWTHEPGCESAAALRAAGLEAKEGGGDV